MVCACKASYLRTTLNRVIPFPDLITLGVLRGFQGLGAAATIPASVRSITPWACETPRLLTESKWQLGILAHAFPPGHARSLAFATFSAGQPLGGGVGFAIGGLLTQLSAYVSSCTSAALHLC